MIGIWFLLNTVISCFWLIYLFASIVRYRRNLLKSNLQQNKGNPPNVSSYNNKTNLVRDAFLVVILVVEWKGALFSLMSIAYGSWQNGCECLGRKNNESIYSLEYVNTSDFSCFLNSNNINIMNSKFNSSLLLLGYSCLTLCLVLVISLCKYLTARYARLSWIKSNTIPYFIFLSVLIIVILNLLKFACYLFFLSECCLFIFEVILLGLMFKESKKLLMVMNWTNTDLSIAQNQKRFLHRSKLMKKRFKRLVIVLWIGGCLYVLNHCFHLSTFGAELVLNLIHNHSEKRSFCMVHISYIPQPVKTILYLLSFISLLFAYTFTEFPLYFTSLINMYKFIWRCFSGKSGYKTHYSYQDLKQPLIK